MHTKHTLHARKATSARAWAFAAGFADSGFESNTRYVNRKAMIMKAATAESVGNE